jgi:hypothetical protein
MAAIQTAEKQPTLQSTKPNPHFVFDPSVFLTPAGSTALTAENPWSAFATGPEMELKSAAQAMGLQVTTTYTLGNTISLWVTRGTAITDQQRGKLEEIAKAKGFHISILSLG